VVLKNEMEKLQIDNENLNKRIVDIENDHKKMVSSELTNHLKIE
jgi:hypothetical protein